MTKNREIIHRQYDDNWIVSITCDICKETYRGQDWNAGSFDVLDTEVSFEFGTHYPEGRSTRKISVDICPRCFEEKLIPLLKELGAEPVEEVESEY